jgi:predicted Zn-dependent protease
MMDFSTINLGNRFCLIPILIAGLLFSSNACTVKNAPVKPGLIPEITVQDPQAQEYGKSLFEKLRKKYDLDPNESKQEELVNVFDKLTKAADVYHVNWHVYLLNGPDIVDIRAVHGNYIFVWSGVLEAVDNVDELAGLLAFELGHILARHTEPVKFTLASDLFFNAAELATSIGLMIASQGAVAISGFGWMKWAYVEISDLDSLDRDYSVKAEQEAANIALLILSRSPYSPQALIDFWERVAKDETSIERYKQLSRDMSPQDRADTLEQCLYQYPLWEYEEILQNTEEQRMLKSQIEE